jgi:archaellum component FlaC
MWEKLIQAIRDIVFLSEQAQRNTEEIKELRKRIEDLTLVVERLAFEIQRTRENEAHEREKLILRLENKPDETKKKLPRSKTKK